MKYINAKTGAVVNVSSILGGDWRPVEEAKKEPPKTKKKTPKKED